ncbi:MAG TPA: DUF2505 domain-containing protein [Jatrophihabitantaceae bacterium]|jgi:hypothetical protein
MRIERSMHNDIPADQVYEMSTSKAFQEQKCRDAGALSWDVQVTDATTGATVKTKRKLPTLGFPSLLRKFVPSGVTSTETIVWAPTRDDGTRTAALSVDFHGAPASMKGTITVVPDGATASTVIIDAEFKAHVPLVAGRVEAFAAPIIMTVIDSEEQTAKAWITEDKAGNQPPR